MIQLQKTISDFSTYVNNRLQLHFTQKPALLPAGELPQINASFFAGRQLNHYETIILLTALAVHIQPVLFNNAIEQYMPKGGEFPEFGGIKGTNTRYMLPTGDTVLFLLAGDDTSKRKQVLG